MLGRALFGWMTTKTIAHAHWTANLMDVQPDDDVLEVGFGNGANIALLAERASNGQVAGAEISKTAVEMASRRNARAISEGRVTLHQAAGGALPFDDDAFDKACTVATMYVIADPSAVFKEMHRVLRPGGLAAVTFPVREKFMRFRPARTDGFHLHELADLEAAFRDTGFIQTRTERDDEVRFGAHCILGHKGAS
jgi:ubiquinone/menaquinone biosynthesis C-methylase UbiE